MANTTVKGAQSVHSTNPQFLIETTIRYRIWDSNFWKEQCFALTAASLIEKAIELKYIGGTYANTRPTEFLCLTLKLLQLQPDKEIIMEYLLAKDFKYLRALAIFYVRLTFDAIDVYTILEPILEEYSKLRYRTMDGKYSIVHMDEFVDQLLTEERVCEIQLPRLTQRRVLEETESLPRRKSKLGRAMGVDLGYGSDASDSDTDRRRRSDSEDEDRYISDSASDDSEQGDGRKRPRSPASARSRSPTPSDRYMSRSPTRSPEP